MVAGGSLRSEEAVRHEGTSGGSSLCPARLPGNKTAAFPFTGKELPHTSVPGDFRLLPECLAFNSCVSGNYPSLAFATPSGSTESIGKF